VARAILLLEGLAGLEPEVEAGLAATGQRVDAAELAEAAADRPGPPGAFK
jgi:hypothetical protein